MSYSTRDKTMIDEAKKKKALLIAFVRKDYNKYKSGANTLRTIGYFKNKDYNMKNIDKYYVQGYDKNVYIISEDPDEMKKLSKIDKLVDKHYQNIYKLFEKNDFDGIITSGPVKYPIVSFFAKKLAKKLFG